MPAHATCPHCLASVSGPAGTLGPCPSCGKPVRLPGRPGPTTLHEPRAEWVDSVEVIEGPEEEPRRRRRAARWPLVFFWSALGTGVLAVLIVAAVVGTRDRSAESPGRGPPAFDPDDPVRTAAWLAELSAPYFEAHNGGNLPAAARERKKIEAALAKLKGRSIRWPARLLAVEPGFVVPKPWEYPADPPVTIEADPGGLPDPGEPWVSRLRRGDSFLVVGTIWEAKVTLGALPDGRVRLLLTLNARPRPIR
jgi:hypothetical protein